ncbi:MAG: LTA synthase family protein [Bacillota bacterium]|nr:LTA synthase family protein [Bacillota bacterium]
MIKRFLLYQKDVLDTITSKPVMMSLFMLILFLALNSLKIALFNFYIIPTQTLETFKYKFIMAILIGLLTYSVVLSIRSRIVFIALYLMQILYIIANISYFLFYHSYLDVTRFILLFNEGFDAVKNSSAPMSFRMLTAFIDLPVFLYIAINYKKIRNIRKRLILYRTIAILASIIFIISIQFSNNAHNNFIATILQDRYRGESPIVQWYGTLINNFVSITRIGDENNIIGSFKYGKTIEVDKDSTDNPNFIVIQVESMDSNVINKKYKNQYITPYLKSLSEKNVYYPYVMSYHKGGGTSDSEFSIINSIEPLEDYPAMKLSNYDYSNSFLKSLAKESYTNIAFHGNSDVFFGRDTAFPEMGFQKFYDIDKMGLKQVGWGAPDKKVFNFAAKTINNLPAPYLAYIITMTSHTPFTNAQNYYNKSAYDDIKNQTVKNYFNSMSYVDECIKNFIDDIRAQDSNTYFFIWGDHAPNITTDLYSQSSFSEGDKFFEFVPLIIITPDYKKYKETKEVASFLDIAPTILDNSGLSFKIKSDGKNLLDMDSIGKEIPFKGRKFDREYLFSILN